MAKYLIILSLLLGLTDCLPLLGQENTVRADTTSLNIKTELSPINNPLIIPNLINISPIILPYGSLLMTPYTSHRQMPWDKEPLIMEPNVPSHIPMDLSLYINTTPHSSSMPGFSDYKAVMSGPLNNSPINYFYGSSTRTLIGLTSLHSKTAGLFYFSNSQKLYASISGNIIQYGHMGMPQNNMGVSAVVEYSPAQWLTLGMRGRYSAFPNQNSTAYRMGFGPGSPLGSYGSYAQVFIYEDFGIQVDIGREFDPMKLRWVTTYGITPVVRRKK